MGKGGKRKGKRAPTMGECVGCPSPAVKGRRECGRCAFESGVRAREYDGRQERLAMRTT